MSDFASFMDGSPDAKTEDPNSFGSFMASVESDRTARLGSNLIAAADTSPDTYAKAMEIGRQIGAPADAVAANLGEGERMAKLQKMREALGSAPKLAELLSSDPDMAKLSSDDFSALTRLEGSMTAAQSFGRGVDLLQSMLYGAAEWSGAATGSKDLASWARRGRQANEAEAAAHGTRSQFLGIRGVGDAAQWGKETLFEQLPLMSPTLAGSLAGAGIGGAVGGPPGAVAGGLIGGFAPSVVMGIGETQGQLKQKDPNAEAPASVAAGGIAIGLLDSILPGKIGGRLVTALGKEVAEQVAHEGIAAAGGALLKGAGLEGATEAAQEAIGEFAAAHGADQAVDWKGLGPQMVEAAAAGFFMGGAFEGGARGIEKLAERQKVADAKKTAAALTEAVAATQESKLATRDPERFADLVRQIAGDGQLHIPAESLQSLYQSGVIDDATLDGLDVAAQLPEALAAGGDVLVDPAKYLVAAAKLTPEALAQIIGSTRRGPTDITLAEAEAFLADPARRKDATDLLESLSIQYEGAKPGQIVEDEVTQALMKTGHYTESQAKAQAVLWRERMVQRGADRGMDPDALWLEEKPRILGPAPRLPVDDIDRHLGGVKPGSTLAQELAAMGITPKEAPGLFRRTGIGSADQVVVSEHEVLRDNQVATDNSGNGYADHDALMQAVAREWAGDPLQTQADRDRAARLDAPVRDLRKALQAEGIIPEFATKEDVLRLMARDQGAAALGQPVNAGVDPNRMVQVVDITGMFGKPRDAKSLVASLRSLVGQPLSTGDQGRIARMLPKHVRHVVHSGAPIRVQDKTVRSASVGGLTVLLAQAPLIESGPNTKTDKKPNVESYHRFYVPIWDGKTVRVLRIVAEQSKSGIVIDPKDFDIYDVVVESKRLPPSRSVPNGEPASTPLQMGGQPLTLSIRQMLSGVKDMAGYPYFQPDDGGLRGSFDPIDDTIRLFESANLSTFLHEGGHLWLFQMVRDLGDERLRPEARDRTVRDLQTVMDWLKVKIDVATASPEDIQAAIPVEAHEQWARGFEAYLMEGKAPSVALRDVFARFSAWLIRTYKKVRNLGVKLTPEVRGVMDRLLASDDAIEQARRDTVFKVPSELLAVLTPAERREIERAQEQAALEAKAELQGRVMKELARERLEWWKTERDGVRAEVEADVRTRPAYRVVALSKGIGPDGARLIDPDTGEARVLKLDRKALVAEYGEEIVRLLPTGVTTALGGVNHHILAGMIGLPNGDALRLALMDAKINPQAEVIERETDARMRERHGDMVTDGRIAEDAADIVATGKAIEAVALQGKCLKRLAGDIIDKAAARRQAEQGAASAASDQARIDAAAASTDQVINAGVPAEGVTAAQVSEAMAVGEVKAAPLQRTAQRAAVRQTRSILASMDHAAIKDAAAAFIAARQVSQATDATMYRAQAKRHERRATLAIAARDYVEAFDAKQQQLLNMELERLARLARTEVEKFQAKARRLNKPDGKLAATMDEDFFKAARQVLSRYGLARADSEFDAGVWVKRLKETDPAGAEDIAAIVANLTEAPTPGRVGVRIMPDGRRVEIAPDYRDMTLAAFRDLRDGVQALLENGKNARSALVDGERVEFEQIVEEARTQLEPFSKDVDLSHMPTDKEKNRRGLLGIAASWRIAESWARLADLGVGVMTKYVIRPVFNAIHAYRAARREMQEKLLAILSPVRDELAKPRVIHATELKDGFHFDNKGQLIHAILHTGNESNMKKLLVGWEWSSLRKDGSFDRSGWDSFMARMWADGVVTKADMDMVQSIWDLLESTKPAAQAAHKAMFGFSFKEIEASPIKTPFGEYRGGYVPAITEKSLNVGGVGQEAVEAMTAQQSAAMFPAAARGFTRDRVENYAEPLTLDLLLLPAHLNKVLLFSHVGPAVRQTARLINRRDFREVVGRYDPVAIDGVLWPMLERAVRQTVETPALTPGGRKAADFARYFRNTAGLQAMCGNLLNAAQQVTGISSAATMVGGGALARSLVTVWRNPESSSAAIMAKSALMRERMSNSAVDAAMNIEAILKDQGALKKGQAFAQRHGYFAQQIAQNLVDRVVWWAAYDKALGQDMAEAEAIQQADSAVRLTQGSFNPESIAAVEAGNAWVRLFTQFMTYFLAQGNMIVSEAKIALRTMTGADLTHRLAGIYVFAFLIPSVLAQAIMDAGRGEFGGDDDDGGWIGYLVRLFTLAQLRFFAATVPVAGPISMLPLNLLNDKQYDDRLASSPGVSFVESGVRGVVTVGKALGGDGDASRAVGDALNLTSLITGIPSGMIRKPASYAVDVAEGDSHPRHIGNVVSGILTGQDGTAR